MKKTAGIIIKILAGFILLILILLFTVPVIFKDKIRTKVEQTIAESLNAQLNLMIITLDFSGISPISPFHFPVFR